MLKSFFQPILVLIVLAVVGFLAWQATYPKRLIVQTHEAIAEARACTENTDCVVVGGSICEFGCYYTINKASKEKISSMISRVADFSSDGCSMDCPAPGEPACVAGQCTQR
jgi:divalent metal cation (Fe/Co/Zn/Cd) transporter